MSRVRSSNHPVSWTWGPSFACPGPRVPARAVSIQLGPDSCVSHHHARPAEITFPPDRGSERRTHRTRHPERPDRHRPRRRGRPAPRRSPPEPSALPDRASRPRREDHRPRQQQWHHGQRPGDLSGRPGPRRHRRSRRKRHVARRRAGGPVVEPGRGRPEHPHSDAPDPRSRRVFPGSSTGSRSARARLSTADSGPQSAPGGVDVHDAPRSAGAAQGPPATSRTRRGP